MMEAIKKTISTDVFVNRLPVIEENGDKLAYPSFNKKYGYDIKINDENIKKLLPVGSDDTLRFNTFRRYYYLVEDFMRTAKVYKRCIRGWQVSDDEEDAVITNDMEYGIYGSTDDIANNNEEKVIIFSDAEKLEEIVPSMLVKDILSIRNFCRQHFIKPDMLPAWAEVPYISVPLFIEADTCDQGKIETAIPQWEVGKAYDNGQFVISDDECYVAKANIGETDNLKYPSENKNFWEHITEKSTAVSTITGIAESQISIFLTKRLYIDDSFQTYPFYLDNDGDICFPYLTGITKDGNSIGKIMGIRCNGNDSREIIDTKFRQIYQNIPEGFSSVTISYAIIGSNEANSDEQWASAVTYTETYAITESAATINKKTQQYFYLETGETLNAAYSNLDAIANNLSHAKAEIKYEVAKKEYSEEMKPILDSFVKISPVGSQDLKIAMDADIDRGRSAMFERMNILSEVKSLNDLENYRNNYFDI